MTHSEELASSYNALASVAEANRELVAIGEEEVVGSLLQIIADAGLEGELGIRLLHKHNDLRPGEIMAENSIEDEDGYALVTTVESSCKLATLKPNSWQFTAAGFSPVEYSNPSLLIADGDASAFESVFTKLAEVLRRYGATHLLGPAINYSPAVMAYAPCADAALLEKTDEDKTANVVRFVDRNDAAFTNSAKTKWHARRIIEENGHISWMTACNCFCSVSENGGHLGTKTHRYNP